MIFLVTKKSSYRVVGMVLCHCAWANAAPSVEESPAVTSAVTEETASADESPLAPAAPATPAATDVLPPVPADVDGVSPDLNDVPTAAELFPVPTVSSPVETAAAAELPADAGALAPKSSQGNSSSVLPPPGPLGGFSNAPAALSLGRGLDRDLLDGFSLSASLSGTYDSNPSQGYATSGSTNEGDFIVTPGVGFSYRSLSSDWTFGADYSGSYSEYFEQSELSGYNQSSGAMVNYEGGPLSASLNVGFDFGSGANRYYGAVVDELSVDYGLSARYRISPKTSLTASLSQAFTSASGDNSSDTDSFSFDASALWRYSALTEFGPGIRYTSETGESGRTSIGPTLSMNYKLAQKVSLTSQVGMDFAQYEDGGSSDPSLTASIGLNYQASRLWGMNLSLYRGTQANRTTAGGFDEITSLSLGYNRKIRRATLNLGVSYETNVAEIPDNGATDRPDTDYLNYSSSLSMPLFGGKATGSVFFNYINQSGDTNSGSGDSTQTGFSLGWNF